MRQPPRRTQDAPEAVTADGLAHLPDTFAVLEEIRDGISGPGGITEVVHEDLAAIRKDMALTQVNTAAIAAAMEKIAAAFSPPPE